MWCVARVLTHARSDAVPHARMQAVIGGAIAVAVVAAALRLRKADDEGELDDAKDTLKKKVFG